MLRRALQRMLAGWANTETFPMTWQATYFQVIETLPVAMLPILVKPCWLMSMCSIDAHTGFPFWTLQESTTWYMNGPPLGPLAWTQAPQSAVFAKREPFMATQ